MKKIDSQKYLNSTPKERFELDKEFYEIFKEKTIENDLLDFIPYKAHGAGRVPIISYNAWHVAMRGACAGSKLSNVEFLCINFEKFLEKALEENDEQYKRELKVIDLICEEKGFENFSDKEVSNALKEQGLAVNGETKVRLWLEELFANNDDFELSKSSAKIVKFLLSKGVSANELVSSEGNLYLMNALSIKGADELVKEVYKEWVVFAINGLGFGVGDGFPKDVDLRFASNINIKESVVSSDEINLIKKLKIIGSKTSPLSEAIITGSSKLLDWYLSNKSYWKPVLWNDIPALTCVEHLIRTDEPKNSKRIELVRQIASEIGLEKNVEVIFKFLHNNLLDKKEQRASLLFAKGLYFASKVQLGEKEIFRLLGKDLKKTIIEDVNQKESLFSVFKEKINSWWSYSGDLNNEGLFGKIREKENDAFSQKVKKNGEKLIAKNFTEKVYESEKEEKLFKMLGASIEGNEYKIFDYIDEEINLKNPSVVVDVIGLLLCIKNVGYFDKKYSLNMNSISIQNTIADTLIKSILKKYPADLIKEETTLFGENLSLAHIACLFDDRAALESLYMLSTENIFPGGAMGAACLAVESGSKKCTDLYVNLLINSPPKEFKERMAANEDKNLYNIEDKNLYNIEDKNLYNIYAHSKNDYYKNKENGKQNGNNGMYVNGLYGVEVEEFSVEKQDGSDISGVAQDLKVKSKDKNYEKDYSKSTENFKDELNKSMNVLKFNESGIYCKNPSVEKFVQTLIGHALMFRNSNSPVWQKHLSRLVGKYSLLGTSSFGVVNELKKISEGLLTVLSEIFEEAQKSKNALVVGSDVAAQPRKPIEVETKLIEHYYWAVSFARQIGINTSKVEESFRGISEVQDVSISDELLSQERGVVKNEIIEGMGIKSDREKVNIKKEPLVEKKARRLL